MPKRTHNISRCPNLRVFALILTMLGFPYIAMSATAPPTTQSAPRPKAGTTQPYVAPPSSFELQTAAGSAPTTAPSTQSVNGDAGWTLLFPGAHRYYVSSSTGSDTAGNGGALHPFKTLARGLKAIKPGDDLLLKRGDTFYENFGNVRLSHNTLGAYGVGQRPAVYADTTSASCIAVLNSTNLRFVGLHLSALHRDPSQPDFKLIEGQYGIYLANCSNVLIEDCLIEFFNDNVSVQGTSNAGFRMRRCVIRDAYSAGSAFSQGIYLDGQRGAIIDECVFTMCGWNATLQDEYTRRGKPAPTSQPAAGEPSLILPATITSLVPKPKQPFPGIANIFNHAIYNNMNNGAGLSTIRNCIFVNSASTAVQQRCGGTIDNCLFIHNGMATDAFTGSDWGQITNNVVLGSASCPPWMGGGGLSLLSKSGILQNNIVAHGSPSEQGGALIVGMQKGYEKNVLPDGWALVDHNVVYDWPAQGIYITVAHPNTTITNNVLAKTKGRLVDVQDGADVNYVFSNNNYEAPADADVPEVKPIMKQKGYSLPDFIKLTNDDLAVTTAPGQTPMVDPSRTIESYAKVLNLAAPTLDAFVAAAELQSREHWDPRLTAPVINDYFREGFSLK